MTAELAVPSLPTVLGQKMLPCILHGSRVRGGLLWPVTYSAESAGSVLHAGDPATILTVSHDLGPMPVLQYIIRGTFTCLPPTHYPTAINRLEVRTSVFLFWWNLAFFQARKGPFDHYIHKRCMYIMPHLHVLKNFWHFRTYLNFLKILNCTTFNLWFFFNAGSRLLSLKKN
jgi:hypothetical protein